MISVCFESAGSPSVVQLSGAPGFPPSLWGTCGTCGVVYVARQTGRVVARPVRDYEARRAELFNYPFTYVRGLWARRIN